ncbi:MAG: four helix bundle protein [Bacteroidales bacterium]|jgi:four helix bundle protein|nr:four helix bundle protein [Bacteroidota bacterium]MBQ9509923.1 four helix bundle protein [Bacteroidales bacterium]MBR6063054.1 four helix bundle protein [Bacteroidales bacterium]
MVKVKTYRDLIVWQKAMEMTVMLYPIASKLPKEETFALCSQMRRAAVSIPSNIAEGFGRNSKKEYLQFLYIAYGSVCELETQLMLCVRIEYLTEIEIQPLMDILTEIGKMITTITKKLKA